VVVTRTRGQGADTARQGPVTAFASRWGSINGPLLPSTQQRRLAHASIDGTTSTKKRATKNKAAQHVHGSHNSTPQDKTARKERLKVLKPGHARRGKGLSNNEPQCATDTSSCATPFPHRLRRGAPSCSVGLCRSGRHRPAARSGWHEIQSVAVTAAAALAFKRPCHESSTCRCRAHGGSPSPTAPRW